MGKSYFSGRNTPANATAFSLSLIKTAKACSPLRPTISLISPQIGEEMSQNSFIKQYLEKQQELLRQRLEREAREAADPESEYDV